MKIALVNPRAKNPNEMQQKCFAPINLLYVASALLVRGHEVNVVDANALGLSDEQVTAQMQRFIPDVVGVSVLSEILNSTYRLLVRIREACPQSIMVMGGAHANALPVRVLEEFTCADYVLRGEAEESFPLLCEALSHRTSFEQVPGLFFRKDGSIRHNATSRPIENLDRLLHPARQLLDALYEQKKYYMILVKERPVDTIITSRGCPFPCAFCSNIPGPYRARSPENVLEELCAIYARGVRSIDIADANFTFDRSRALRIFELIAKEKLGISLRIKSRSDSLDRELVRLAKEAGVYLISLGMESGSQGLLSRMQKGTRIEQNLEACSMVMRAGIKLNTGWIIGFPGETPETIRQTAQLILRIRPTTANINALIPYPGTAVYEEAASNGTLVGDWSVHNAHSPWIQLPWISTYATLQAWVRWVKNKVYYRPYYISHFAKEVLYNFNFPLARYMLQEACTSFGFEGLREQRQ